MGFGEISAGVNGRVLKVLLLEALKTGVNDRCSAGTLLFKYLEFFRSDLTSALQLFTLRAVPSVVLAVHGGCSFPPPFRAVVDGLNRGRYRLEPYY